MSDKREMHRIPRTLPGGGGMSFRPAGWKASSRPELYAPGTLHSFRHLQIFGSLPFLPLQETSDWRTDLTILADPNPGTLPWFETYSNLILKLQYSVTWSLIQLTWLETSVFSNCNRNSSKTWNSFVRFWASVRRQKRAFQSIGPLTLMLIRLFSLVYIQCRKFNRKNGRKPLLPEISGSLALSITLIW